MSKPNYSRNLSISGLFYWTKSLELTTVDIRCAFVSLSVLAKSPELLNNSISKIFVLFCIFFHLCITKDFSHESGG